MRVRVSGIFIPNTNVWDIDEDWTARHLVIDVINLVSSKRDDGWGYHLEHDGNEIPDETFLTEVFDEDTEFFIVGN